MTTFPLRLTEELKALATAQAARADACLDQYTANLLAVQRLWSNGSGNGA